MGTDLVRRLWMKIIDPATAYAIDRSVADDVRRRPWTDRPTSVFGPGCPPGGRAPTDEELARFGPLHGRLPGTEADAPAPADPTVLSHAVDQLLARGAATVSFGTVSIGRGSSGSGTATTCCT